MTQIINIIQKEQSEQTMTSLEIAELTGKQHKDLLKAIRNMEPAWEKTCGRKFALTSRSIIQPNGGKESWKNHGDGSEVNPESWTQLKGSLQSLSYI